MSATARLLDFARADHRLPADVRADALRLLGDTLAVGAAGRRLSEEAGVVRAARGWGAGNDARLIGGGDRLPAPSAAFVNGFRTHCLEWDAVHEGAVVHAMSVVTAALGAAIDRRGGCDPEEALAALAVGVDVAAGLGIAATGPMRFFRPAVAGAIGAALVVARVERAERFDDVLGLAYSQAAGTMQAHAEGSIALPLQIGFAARAAVAAVDLAAAGLSGPHDVLEGPFGYFRLFEEGSLSTYTQDIGGKWRIGEVSVKPFPSGRASHAALAVLAELAPAPDQVERVEAHVPPLIQRLVGRPFKPDMTPAYARLCLPFLAAQMIERGRIDPRETAASPDLAARIVVHPDGSADPNAMTPQTIILVLKDGRRIERRVEHVLGSPEAPLSSAQAGAKYALARELAGDGGDPRPFDDPLGYFTEPR
ncbi:MAG: MmgE/PrpD family protein [Allosphingosinicella sp.]|uniref:MmgE/PrpD family protein n=1 Tax=Allosphingosinicella sp. TaxID=2823234 RepID=UPI00394F5239